jgi:hypothetical protein
MDCLFGYISLDVCGNESSASGYSILTLPGITLQSLDATATEDQITYVQLWEDAQKEAALRFKADFMTKVRECFEINTECNYEDFICNNKEILVNAWRYLLGNQLMIYRLYSTRLNRFTTIDIEEAKQLKDFYQIEYESALAQGVKAVDFSDCCMPCNTSIQTVTWLP